MLLSHLSPCCNIEALGPFPNYSRPSQPIVGKHRQPSFFGTLPKNIPASLLGMLHSEGVGTFSKPSQPVVGKHGQPKLTPNASIIFKIKSSHVPSPYHPTVGKHGQPKPIPTSQTLRTPIVRKRAAKTPPISIGQI